MERKPKNDWTIGLCIVDARKYANISEWKKNSKDAYRVACENGWLDECCAHMKRIGTKYKKLVYAFVFPDNHIYVGLCFNEERKNILLNSPNNPVYNHILKTNQSPKYERLSDYILKGEASKLKQQYVEQYRNQGYKILY
jgi:hypothetical protein